MTDDPVTPAEPPRDLGFGSVVADQSRRRLLNQDGSFNVERHGLDWRFVLSPYEALLEMGWGRFALAVAVGFVAANALFALLYLALGPGALLGDDDLEGFARAFFFSVETLTTIGYGHVAPAGIGAHLVVTLESLVGLFGVALVAGMSFARFARPRAEIAFSSHAVVAPYRQGTGLMFRLANQRRSQLVEVEAKVVLARFESLGGRRVRRFHSLTLERDRVVFLPLAWTVVHPIDGDSPLAERGADLCESDEVELLVLVTGIDEASHQKVHARTSYRGGEIVWQARFRSIFESAPDDGPLSIDLRRLDEIEHLSP